MQPRETLANTNQDRNKELTEEQAARLTDMHACSCSTINQYRNYTLLQSKNTCIVDHITRVYINFFINTIYICRLHQNSGNLSSIRFQELDSFPGEIRVVTAEMAISSSFLVPEFASSHQIQMNRHHSRPEIEALLDHLQYVFVRKFPSLVRVHEHRKRIRDSNGIRNLLIKLRNFRYI